MARRMFLLKECDALLCREGGLDRGRSSKLGGVGVDQGKAMIEDAADTSDT